MRIVFFEIREREQELLSGMFPGHEVIFMSERLTLESAGQVKDADIVSVFVDSLVTGEIMGKLPSLKCVATRSTGFDHIDCTHAKEKGIAVAHVPEYGAHTVAEFAFALILSLSRRVYAASNKIKEQGDFSLGGLRGFDLFGKTIGIIGTGRIGKNVAGIAKGFGMKVLAVDPYPDTAFAQSVGASYVSLAELLSASDIVTLHAPYNASTRHLINIENSALMKKGALLINTARGELVDTQALVQALSSGQLAGAGLDVLEGERMLKEEAAFLTRGKGSETDLKLLAADHMLISMPNVIVTPHIAFYSREAEEEIVRTTVATILGFISGVPQNLVTP